MKVQKEDGLLFQQLHRTGKYLQNCLVVNIFRKNVGASLYQKLHNLQV